MTGPAYADGTAVPVSKTVAELRDVVERYGGTSWVHAEHEGRAMVGWTHAGRMVRFVLVLPTLDTPRVLYVNPDRRQLRQASHRPAALRAEERRVWRVLFMVVKAKLVAVSEGVTEFDREFLANIVVPGGTTVYDAIAPQLFPALNSGQAPGDLLPLTLTGGRS